MKNFQTFMDSMDKHIKQQAKAFGFEPLDYIATKHCYRVLREFVDNELNLTEELISAFLKKPVVEIKNIEYAVICLWIEIRDNNNKPSLERIMYEELYDFAMKYNESKEMFESLQTELNNTQNKKRTFKI